QFPPFQSWLKSLDDQLCSSTISVSKVRIQGIDLFGSGKIGFIKFVADAQHATGQRVPGIVFMRGGSVSMLIILRTEKGPRVPSFQDHSSYVLLTEQARMPVANFQMRELPAGMLDGETGEFAGTAAKEIREETGLVIRPGDLVDLTQEVVQGTSDLGMYPSAGGCDEFVRLFAAEKIVSPQELAELRGKLSGLRDQGELITLRLVRLSELWRETRDLKATAALYLWDRLQ
ncbi:hypothetical protein DL89DRAFT_210142, partial [Linderina pennispora]